MIFHLALSTVQRKQGKARYPCQKDNRLLNQALMLHPTIFGDIDKQVIDDAFYITIYNIDTLAMLLQIRIF